MSRTRWYACTVRSMTVALLTLASASPALALSDNFSLSDSNQSIIAGGGGVGTNVTFNTPNFFFDPPSIGPGITCALGVCGGFDASLSAIGQVGLSLSVGTSGGTAAVDLPLAATLNVSSNYLSAPSFNVSVSGGLQTPSAPILTIQPLGVQASLGAHVSLTAAVAGEVCYLAGCSSGSQTLVNVNTAAPLIGVDTSVASPLTVGGASVPLPGYNTPQSITVAGKTLGTYEVSSPTEAAGGVLTSNRTATLDVSQPILNATEDAAKALGVPTTGVMTSISGLLDVNFTALNLEPSVAIGLDQKFTLNAPLSERLTFSAPVNEIVGGKTIATDVTEVTLGVSDPSLPSSATLQWAGTPGHLVSRTYGLDNPSLNNRTAGAVTPSMQVTAFKGSLDFVPSLDGPMLNFCAFCDTLSQTFNPVLYNQAAPLAFGTQSYAFADPASAKVTPGSITLAARVHSTAPSAFVGVANTAGAGSDSLDFSGNASGSPFDGSGSGSLAPGAAAAPGIKVSLRTDRSGEFTGTETVKLQSAGDQSGVASSLASQTVALKGKVWTTAVASATRAVDFGIVHVRDTVAARSITVSNTASGALTDQLVGGWGSATTPFTTKGTFDPLDAGHSNDHLSVGLDTASAGVFTGKATLALSSHDSDLADVAVATSPINLSAQVNNFAAAGFQLLRGAGTLTGGGTAYTLDFGTVTSLSGIDAVLGVANIADGPADYLGGTFAETGTGFGFGGADAFGGIAAGGYHAMSVALDAMTAGAFTADLTLDPYGYNASGYEGALAAITLAISADFEPAGPVNEPDSLAILAIGFLGLGLVRPGRVTRG